MCVEYIGDRKKKNQKSMCLTVEKFTYGCLAIENKRKQKNKTHTHSSHAPVHTHTGARLREKIREMVKLVTLICVGIYMIINSIGKNLNK